MPLALTSFTALPATLVPPPASLTGTVGPLTGTVGSLTGVVSPLTIADQLITLAEEADRAGFLATASQLVHMAYSVLDENAVRT